MAKLTGEVTSIGMTRKFLDLYEEWNVYQPLFHIKAGNKELVASAGKKIWILRSEEEQRYKSYKAMVGKKVDVTYLFRIGKRLFFAKVKLRQ